MQGNTETREDLARRLRRIEGQVKGVQKMIDEGRDCREILQQLAAVRSAVQSASFTYMQQVACDCALGLDQIPQAERPQAIRELVELLGKSA